MQIGQMKRDDKEHNNGAWIKTIISIPGVSLKVKGWSSVAVTAFRSALERDVTADQRNPDGSVMDTVRMEIVMKTCAMVLVDWDGIEDGDKPLKFTEARAKKMIFDPNYVPFCDGIVAASVLADRRRMTEKRDAVKN